MNIQKQRCIETGLAEQEGDSQDLKDAKTELRESFIEDPEESFLTLLKISDKTIEELESEESNTFSGEEIEYEYAEEYDNSEQEEERVSKQFLGTLNAELIKASKWFNENKEKSLSDIMVGGWKEDCSEPNLQNSFDNCKKRNMQLGNPKPEAACKKNKRDKENLNVKYFWTDRQGRL